MTLVLVRLLRLPAPATLGFLLLLGWTCTFSAAAATRQVTNTNDSGAGSLRAVIAAASAGDTIEFDSALFTGALPKSIRLTSGPLIIGKNLVIIGPGDGAENNVPMLVLDGRGACRILEIDSPAEVSIAGLTLKNGRASRGAAVYISTGSTVSFFACDFIENCATGSEGGGAILNRGNLILDECLVASNSAPVGGGIASCGTLQITRSLIDCNNADGLGGGIFSNGANLWIESSTISGNRGGTGGGIAFRASDYPKRTATVTAATIADNSAREYAGGLYVEGSNAKAIVGGSIFAYNFIRSHYSSQIPRDLATRKSGKIDSADYNIVIKPGETLSPSAPHDQIGVDPLLGPLVYNGGRTRTRAITFGSPALDRGDPAFAGVLVATDQRGSPRVQPTPDGRVDVGAFEFARPTLTCPEEFEFECQGGHTSGEITATLTLPGGGPVTVKWTINGTTTPPAAVNIPADGGPVELSHVGTLNAGLNNAKVTVKGDGFILTCEMLVRVVDTTRPEITLVGASSITSECGTTYLDPGATATDVCGGSIAVIADISGVNIHELGIYTVYYTAVDAAGNEATASRLVSIVDTIAPVLAPVTPTSVEFEATNPATCASDAIDSLGLTLSAFDACDPAPAIVYEIDADGGGFHTITFPRTFPIGTTTVHISARDASGNRSARQTVSVIVQDGAPPGVALLGDASVTIELGESFEDPGVTASDACSAPVSVVRTVNGDPEADVDPCKPGIYEITYTAFDTAGNSSSVIRTVTVAANIQLSTAPTIQSDLDPALRAASIDLANIVTVSGLPPDCGDTILLAVHVEPPDGEPVTLDGLGSFNFPVGTSNVLVEALLQTNEEDVVVLASTTFEVVISDPFGVTLPNVAWPLAIELGTSSVVAASGQLSFATFRQMIARAGESRWYKIQAAPGSRINVMLTNLPANYDVVVYSDILKAYDDLLALIDGGSTSDSLLALLGAEFAPEAYSPEAYSPEAYSPEAYSPEAYSPEAYSPEAYSPEAYSPEAYSPEAYSPEAYSPEAYSPEAYSPEAYSPEAYSPEAYASAQQRSRIAFSASPGTTSENVRFNTYNSSGEFYIRVRGQNGVFSTQAPFDLLVEIEQDLCTGVADLDATPSTTPIVTGAPASLLVWDSSRIDGTATEKAALATSLSAFASAANGVVVDVAADARVVALNAQADANPFCPIAKNLIAETIRGIVRAYRTAAPSIEDITLIGPDDVIPFFRTADEALLASEANYFPPVLDPTHSQSALRYAQILTQDAFGSSCEVFLATGRYILPEAPVGRLVETATEVRAYLDGYRELFDGTVGANGVVPAPDSALSVGYDFLADVAEAIRDELAAGLGAGAVVNQLISPIDQPPVSGWTADQLRSAFLGARHDVSYLAAHFSTSGALAADYTTRFTAADVADSSLNLQYALIISPGCHSGYSTVDSHAVPIVTEQPDWAQAFARKQSILISGTGYQYGDTDFIEYTERLHLELVRALRRGTGPVSIGRALVEAKNRYLTETPLMRGIHEKTLVQATLYGLPMVKLDFPGARLGTDTPTGDVPAAGPVAGAGAAHGLKVGHLTFAPDLTRVDETLDVVGTTDTVVASYFTGSDGIISNPGEPVRPLESFNASRPADGLVRGVGFRGGLYSDIGDFVPFTGAVATETRGVHGRFLTEVFYPVLPWNVNQIGVLCDAAGVSILNTFPTQFVSDDAEAITGTLRRYDQMSFSVFYCPAVSADALANPPAINVVSSMVDASGAHFSVEVAAGETVGVQEVWITYTGLPGSTYHGSWQSLTLTGPGNATGIGTWNGTLPLASGVDPAQVRFIVQAVNGIGAVAQSTNFGRYFTLGESTLDNVNVVGSPTSLTLVEPIPAGGVYRESIEIKAMLTDAAAVPLAGKRVSFRIGPASVSAFTDAAGVATTTLLLNARPDAYELEAAFAGDATHQSSTASTPFLVSKSPTQLTFESDAIVADALQVVAALEAIDGTPLKERTVVFILTSDSGTLAIAEITDGAGRARVNRPVPGGRTYQVSAYFGQPVALPGGSIVTLDDPLYGPSDASATIKIGTDLRFFDEHAWVIYTDKDAPGATLANRGHSKTEIAGRIASDDPLFSHTSILASPKAKYVKVQVHAQLSGTTLAEGMLTLRVQSSGASHWHGDAKLGGSRVKLHVDWDRHGCDGRYRVWIDTPSGNGPLYNDLPAILTFELVFGVGPDELPTGGVSVIGGTDKPWTLETPHSRIRTCD